MLRHTPIILQISDRSGASTFLSLLSHFLKGSCGNISAGYLRDIFGELEVKGKNNEIEGLEKYLPQIDQKFEELLEYVGALRAKLS